MKTIQNYFLALALGWAATAPVLANDGVYYTSGNQLVPLAETDIQVAKEVLTIELNSSEFAKVDVQYEFYNPGKTAKTVLMGFEAMPSYNDDYTYHVNGVHPSIHDFTVTFNGQSLSYKNAVADISQGVKFLDNPNDWELGEWGTTLEHKRDTSRVIEEMAYVYYFNATFQPGINRVHHTYSYRKSAHIGTSYEIPYSLTPAGRWAGGKIKDFTLRIKTPKTSKHFFLMCSDFNNTAFTVESGMAKDRHNSGMMGDTPMREVSMRDATLSVHLTNYHPESDLCITSADMEYTFSDTAELGDYYDRDTTMPLSMFLDSRENRGEMFDDDFSLSVIRNLPYADRGRIFKRKDLDTYFRARWWYMPDPNYTDNSSDFTTTDWHYVRRGKK